MSKEEEWYGIRPAPGTCCPDMKVKDCVCQGCGKVYEKPSPTKG